MKLLCFVVIVIQEPKKQSNAGKKTKLKYNEKLMKHKLGKTKHMNLQNHGRIPMPTQKYKI